jgi:hypothetical protein
MIAYLASIIWLRHSIFAGDLNDRARIRSLVATSGPLVGCIHCDKRAACRYNAAESRTVI